MQDMRAGCLIITSLVVEIVSFTIAEAEKALKDRRKEDEGK